MKNKVLVKLCFFVLLLPACNNMGGMRQYEKYIGKTVNDFLIDNRGYSKIEIKGGKPGCAYALRVKYPTDSVSVELIPSEFRYMKKFDRYGVWDINLFKKETISIIRVYKCDTITIEIPMPEGGLNRDIKY